MEKMVTDEKKVTSVVSLKNICILEGESPKLTVEFPSCMNGERVEATLSLDEMTPSSLKKCILKNQGICLDGKKLYVSLLEEYGRQAMRRTLQVFKFHKRLGWNKMEEKISFLANEVVSVDDEKSEYIGNKAVKPQGNIENISTMIKENILSCEEWSPLQAVVAFSVAATILPFAKMEWGIEMDNFIIHLIGGSTTGKSTSLKLHASLGSNITDKKNSFWITHDSSLPAIISRIGDNKGFPVAIDELSSGTKKEYNDFVYNLGNGEEKDRMKAGGVGLQKSATFSTIILSSGEVSILRKCSVNEGIRARCIEIANEQWTESKEQANAIVNCLKSNHGLVPPLVAEELLKNSEEWKEYWNQIEKKVQDRIAKDEVCVSIIPRVADFVVLFTVAATLANKVLDIELDIEKVFEFCYEYIIIANAEEANLAKRVYSYILEYYSMHKDLFALGDYMGCQSQFNVYYLNDNEEGIVRDAYRKRLINGQVYEKQIIFRKSVMEHILDEGGFSVKVALAKLKEGKYLLTHDNKRCTKEVTINDVTQDTVIVFFREDIMNGVDLDAEE